MRRIEIDRALRHAYNRRGQSGSDERQKAVGPQCKQGQFVLLLTLRTGSLTRPYIENGKLPFFNPCAPGKLATSD